MTAPTVTPSNTLQAILYTGKELKILNQLLLPHKSEYEQIKTTKDGYNAIKSMKVRGAPAIAIVAVLSICVEVRSFKVDISAKDIIEWVKNECEYLSDARPTAVNLTEALSRLTALLENMKTSSNKDEVISKVLKFGDDLFEQDVLDNKNIGKNGADFLLSKLQSNSEKLKILTHCNTGSLATANYGTALGIIRRLSELDKLEQVFCTETRPYNQGSRLTAYELVTDNLPKPTLICDSMAAYLMSTNKIDAVILGADRVASNGDTANKIGTLQLAVLCKHFGVEFIVAAPTTSIDMKLKSGGEIKIEERSKQEMIQVQGMLVSDEKSERNCEMVKVCIAPKGINAWNPAFDVTPANLIDAVVTEKGVVVKKDGVNSFDFDEITKY